MSSLSIQLCGTGSNVGKSILTAAFCRILLEDGYRVCPFKAQNMSLNSFVTKEGGEIGRAQAVQAQACRIAPHTDMNPVLIKPTCDTKAQIILQGLPLRNMTAQKYHGYKKTALKKVVASFKRLRRQYDVVVLEGAGSPAEINLKASDIANLRMAKIADAPVLLIGDIDKGGVFASFVGTLELLNAAERRRIKGFIINKFRGDINLLKSGIRFLERKTSRPVVAVIPYFKNLRIPQEDSVVLEKPAFKKNGGGKRAGEKLFLDIAVVGLRHMSNFTDFDALALEPDVCVRYVRRPEELAGPDIIIIPGTKNTLEDLKTIRGSGLADNILSCVKSRPQTVLVGICGGFQMLGAEIRDPDGIESKHKATQGLGLLPIVTTFEKEKILKLVEAEHKESGNKISGYEIHHGRTQAVKDIRPVFDILSRNGRRISSSDGAATQDGRIWGTYIHGVFDADFFRRHFLNTVRCRKKWRPIEEITSWDIDAELDKLSRLVRQHTNMRLFYKILTKND